MYDKKMPADLDIKNVDTNNVDTNSEAFSQEDALISPLRLYSEYQRMDIELRSPETMPISHWHGQVEVNIPFDGDIDYMINGEIIRLKQGHITIFWACVPHRLIDSGNCKQMAIFNLPMHLFLSWSINRELINHITHGMVIQSQFPQQISTSEIKRWQQEISHNNQQIKQLAIDEITIMIKRFSLAGWLPLVVNHTSETQQNGVSKHAQFYVSQILEYIAAHHDTKLTVQQIAEHVQLNQNYAMGIFQRVMQLSIKQYITVMRINHTRVLLSDSGKSILDIALTAGFNSSSRFYDTFKKHVGMTPRQYRKLCQEKQNLSIT